MTHINDLDNGFRARVAFAAKVISSGRRTTRTFDSCFENHDGDAVALALFRRAQRRPNTKLCANLWRYLSQTMVTDLAYSETDREDLESWSRDLIARARKR